MRQVQLRESESAVLELKPHQELALRRLGEQLASSSTWWGRLGSGEGTEGRSVIRVVPNSAHRFNVTVLNMVGAISLDGLHLHIQPKIPLHHFLHIIQRGVVEPRSASEAKLEPDNNWAELVARWFTAEAEVLLRRGLRSDYVECTEELSAIRGRVDILETALLIQQGRPVAVCSFDDLVPDAPLNRLIKGAARAIAKNINLSAYVRDRARSVRRRLQGVGDERQNDHHVAVDRLDRGYASAVSLAKLVLLGLGVGINFGDSTGKTFLIRTPELVEEGIRKIITRALSGTKVASGRLMLGSTGLSMNPDLVFDDGRAVGDVKYKLFNQNWNRSDLYQALAFATAYRSRNALLIGFHKGALPLYRVLKVGDIFCRLVAWDARAEVSAATAQDDFEGELLGWQTEQLNAPGITCTSTT